MKTIDASMLIIIGVCSLLLYSGSILLIESVGCTVLLLIADIASVTGLIFTLMNRKISHRIYFIIFFVFTAILISYTLGVLVQYPFFHITETLRACAYFILGFCGTIIIVSGFKMYAQNFISKFLFFAGFATTIITEISVLSIPPENFFGLLFGCYVALWALGGALVLMFGGTIYGIINHKTEIAIK